ncbi:MAG: hypothetical protein DMD81_16845 [Candidatus Rokuibacteriota bacterium]|nr:MAG: hypothetical protein DMD81_16845 [Candidatus Rokubacteria bacterium]
MTAPTVSVAPSASSPAGRAPAVPPRSFARAAFDWLRRWGVSIGSFVSGLLTLFVFRRDLPHVGWIVGYVILLWLLFAVLALTRPASSHAAQPEPLGSGRGRRVRTAADYAVQTLHHGLLLFMLPAYYASTTFTSVNVVFLTVLAGLTLLATFDPWYRTLVHPRPWLGLTFFVVSVFAALNVALPLIGVRPNVALLLAAWTATVAVTPAVHRGGRSWQRALSLTCAGGVVAAALVYAGRAAIPPAPISVARAAIAWDVDGGEPIDPLGGTIAAQKIRDNGGLVAYTAVYAPAGLRQPIAHVWRRNGRIVNVVTLTPVRGGRRQGFRTYSRKAAFPANPAGAWTVDVTTPSGQLIGRLRFRVTSTETP